MPANMHWAVNQDELVGLTLLYWLYTTCLFVYCNLKTIGPSDVLYAGPPHGRRE